MQTQKRPLPASVPVPKKAATTQAKLQSAPVALDAKALQQVTGGTGTNPSGPHKTW